MYMIFTMGAMVQEHPIRQLSRKLDIQYLGEKKNISNMKTL